LICVSSRRGVFKQVEVYHPRPEQISEFLIRLRPLDVLLVHGSPLRPAPCDAIGSEFEFQTTMVDLSLPESELWQRMHYDDWRRKLRKAERLGDRLVVRKNDSGARADFLAMHNRFVDQKGLRARPLTWARMAKFDGLYDVFTAYVDGKPFASKVTLRDEDEHRIEMLFAVNARLDGGIDHALVGCVNRYLFWHVMRHYKASGFVAYNFAGINPKELPTITRFKLSFGGEVVTLYDYVAAGRLARGAIRLRAAAHRLFQRAGVERRVWQI